jgi:hypothetical protein
MPEEKCHDLIDTAAFVEKHLDPKLVDLGTQKVLVVPKDAQLKSIKGLLDEYKTKPERIKGIARHTTLESFTDHAVRFADKESALFAHRDPKAPSLLAVYDYHPTVPDAGGVAAAEARFSEHRSLYSFPVSDEWTTWNQYNGTKLDQGQFAEFLENHIHNVTDPLGALKETVAIMEMLLCKFTGPSGLMELARGLTVREASVVANQHKLGSGEVTFRYDTKHLDEAGAPLTVPGAFLLSIPVFRGGDNYQLAARLRYRLANGLLTWWYELHRARETFDHAFDQACEKAKTDTKLPLFYGSPEAP